MRDNGIPKLLTWRWAPCAALVLGAVSFVGFALLVIPDRIGGLAAEGSGPGLANHFARTQPGSAPGSKWSGSNAEATDNEPPATAAITHLASRASEGFPKRGFSPPLDRPEGPAPAAAQPAPPPAPEAPAPPPPGPEVPAMPPPDATAAPAPAPASP